MMVMNIAADKNRKRKKQTQEHTLERGSTARTRGSLGYTGPRSDPAQPWPLPRQQEPLGAIWDRARNIRDSPARAASHGLGGEKELQLLGTLILGSL